MKLDWKSGAIISSYEADLPPIPGYTNKTGEATVLIQQYEPQGPGDFGWNEPDYIYYFTIYVPYDAVDVPLNYVPLDWRYFGVPELGEWDDVDGSAEDMMSYIERLTPEEIADNLKEHGYPPVED